MDVLPGPESYSFWLFWGGLACFLLERAAPWRPAQPWTRPGLGQDAFLLVFNGFLLGMALAWPATSLVWLVESALRAGGLTPPAELAWVTRLPLGVQVVIYLLLADFLEWCVHVNLHRRRLLWGFHQLHHSITTLDWIGNFRFHWMEVVLYKSFKWLPLAVLGASWEAIHIASVISLTMGYLNHANLRTDWGPLRLVLNSPRLHVWHHDVELHGRGGQNFGVVFSLWDRLFGTLYYPEDEEAPRRLGFGGQERFPAALWRRLLYPLFQKGGGGAPGQGAPPH